MKFLLFLAAIFACALALTPEQLAKLDVHSQKCKAITGINQETIDKLRAGEQVDDPKIKQQVLCVSKELGLINEAGDLNEAKIKALVRKHTDTDTAAEDIVKKCLVEKGSKEESAKEAFICLRREQPAFSPVE